MPRSVKLRLALFWLACIICLPVPAPAQSQTPSAVPGAAASTSSNKGKTMTQTATGSFAVKLQPLTFEGTDPAADAGAKLARMSIDKQISGDLVATTKGQMLSAMTSTKGSAGYVAIEQVQGTLHGKRGSFVLQHTGVMNRGAPALVVTVVPDSGTDELLGLEGEFQIKIADGKHNYEFSYRLPSR
jgi:Protein of unknown function (DUF3224)